MPNLPLFAYIVGAIIIAALALLVLFKAFWKNPSADQALVISDVRRKDDTGKPVYRVVVGHGTVVAPLISRVSTIGLQIRTAGLSVNCTTSQGIPVVVEGVVMFKVGDTDVDITNAAKRFLDQQDDMRNLTVLTFDGHLRSIVGGMTVEELLSDRRGLTENTLDSSGIEMAKLGLAIDSLQISNITDPTGYIDSLSAPHVAEVKSKARIAQAQRNQEASIAEAASQAEVAEAERASRIRQAAAQAEVDKAQAESAQAGPLAEATARQKVTEAETSTARLAAGLKEQLLLTEVQRPADAEAYRVRTLAEAQRAATISAAQAAAEQRKLQGAAEAEATRATGQATADVRRANGEAEAAAIKARAEALATNQQAVLAQQFVERFPEIVAAAAAPLGNIDQLTVLNGADGVTGIVSQVLGQVFALFPDLQGKLGAFTRTNMGTAAPATDHTELVATGTADDGRVSG